MIVSGTAIIQSENQRDTISFLRSAVQTAFKL